MQKQSFREVSTLCSRENAELEMTLSTNRSLAEGLTKIGLTQAAYMITSCSDLISEPPEEATLHRNNFSFTLKCTKMSLDFDEAS